MINDYLYELIGIIVVFTAVIIYILMRRSPKQTDKEPLEEIQQNEKVLEDASPIVDAQDEIEEKPQEAPAETLKAIEEPIEEEPVALNIGKEEGSFGIDETTLSNSSEVTEPTTKKLRQKGKVPEHGKISKEDFKEFSGVKLLIAEDNLINQKVLKGLLNESGIELTMADDGQFALDILEKNSNFDMILMDAHMPRVDGFEATRTIRNNPKYDHILIVAFSGDVASDDIHKMTEAGMEEHLEKPLRIDDFYDILYAYTKSGNNQVEEVSTQMNFVAKELKIQVGLDICGGDEGFYKEILSEFTTTYNNASTELLELLRNKELQRADKLLLDLIGVTANIGADDMTKSATKLKNAIRDMQEDSYLNILDNFDVHLELLLKEIAAYNK